MVTAFRCYLGLWLVFWIPPVIKASDWMVIYNEKIRRFDSSNEKKRGRKQSGVQLLLYCARVGWNRIIAELRGPIVFRLLSGRENNNEKITRGIDEGN